MNAKPVIILLEDERAQLLALRATLSGLGELREFGDSAEALAFLRQRPADVAIIDIHMPKSRMNGMELIKAVRVFDRDLSVIVRTGDTSSTLADGAIEAQVFRRVIKGRISTDELRSLTVAAVRETSARRKVAIDAANAAEVRTQLVATLGSQEEELAVIDTYKAFFQKLRSQITAIGGQAEILEQAACKTDNQVLLRSASRNKAMVRDLVAEVNSFLDGPYSEALHATLTKGRATVNGVIEAVRKRFATNPRWLSEQRAVVATGLMQDLFVSVSPTRLITAIRHTVEFCLVRIPPQSACRLAAYFFEDARSAVTATKGSLLLNENELAKAGPRIAFRISACMPGVRLDDIKSALLYSQGDLREGNLQMIAIALASEHPALAIGQTAETTTFELFLDIRC